MSITPKKMNLARAEQLARAVRADLLPGCDRIEIAGSIRRRKPEVGDIELVAIPTRSTDLLGGQADSLLDGIIDRLCLKRHLIKVKGGDRYKQFHVPDTDFTRSGVGSYLCKLDLFICDPETWGVIFAIRTGSADFSRQLVTQQSKGGLCPDDMYIRDGRLWKRMANTGPEPGDEDCPLATPEETDVFAAMGLKWVQPCDRR